MRRIGLVLFCAALAAGTPVSAQMVPRLDSASRVRVTAPRHGLREQVATVVAQRSDTLWVRKVPQGDITSLATSDLSRLDVSTGRRGHALAGAGLGLLAGAVLGGGLGYAFPSSGENCLYCGRGYDAAAGAVVGGSVGAVLGALIGASHKTERWRSVLAEPVVSAGLDRSSGIRVQVRRRF